MRYSGRLGGGTMTILKYQAGADMATVGVPVVAAGANQYGIQLASTITAINTIGLTLDTATVANSQAANADTERSVSVAVNPDAIYRAKLSGGATSNTAITIGTEVTGSATGLLVDTAVDYSSPSIDEGGIVGIGGANAGFARKITSLTGANAVVITAFPYDIAVGDTFISVPFAVSGSQGTQINAMGRQYIQLTTTLDQVDQSVAVDTDNVNFIPLRLILPADMNRASTQMYVDLLNYDHLYGGGQLA
jgi:hypothetical protein